MALAASVEEAEAYLRKLRTGMLPCLSYFPKEVRIRLNAQCIRKNAEHVGEQVGARRRTRLKCGVRQGPWDNLTDVRLCCWLGLCRRGGCLYM